ncbi:MAG: hypothetical protein PT957_03840 [Firmicutes bacterium]|nr:hypothetical protein [Bacillota bacterium]
MKNVSGAGLVPVTIHFRDSRLPDLVLHEGEVGTRGYKARFVSSDGELIAPSEGQVATCYAKNIDTGNSFYLEGIPREDYWEIEVPSKALSSGGTVDLQIALKEGDKALIMTSWSTVRVEQFIGGGNAKDGTGILMDFQKLHEQAEGAKAALEAVTRQAEEADRRAKKAEEALIRIESNEGSRESAEKERAQAEDLRKKAEALRKEAEDLRIAAEKARVDEERIRASQENIRANQELGRVNSEGARESAEGERKRSEASRESEESARNAAEKNRDSQEQIRANEELTRVSAEKERVDAETKRISSEQDRVQSEEGRKSSEEMRQSKENERLTAEVLRDTSEKERTQAEGIRAANETNREEAERLRASKENERQADESARRSQENTREAKETDRQSGEDKRKRNETQRISQENIRVQAENERKSVFAGWDKTMSGIMPNGSETVLGAVKVQGKDGESVPYTVPSMGKTQAMIDGLSSKIDNKANKTHDHDDRYYSKQETDDKLAMRAEKSHGHPMADITGLDQALELAGKVKSVNGMTGDVTVPIYDDSGLRAELSKKQDKLIAGSNITLSGSSISAKDTTYSPATQSVAGLLSAGDKVKIDGLENALDAKSNVGHIHDDRYYTQSRLDTMLSGKSDSGHTHPDYLTISQAGEVYQTKSAMTLYATKEDLEKMGGSSYIYQLAEFDTTAGPECLQALKRKKSIEEIVADPLAWTAVLQSSSAIKKVIESNEAMKVVANNNQAMTSVEKSLFLMNEVARSPGAMLAIANSPTAIKIIESSSRCKKQYKDLFSSSSDNALPISKRSRGYATDINGQKISLSDKSFEHVKKNPWSTVATSIITAYDDDSVKYYDLNA